MFEAATWVKSMYMTKSLFKKTENKRKYGNHSNCYINDKSASKRWFRNGIHSLLSRADARGSADIIYHM